MSQSHASPDGQPAAVTRVGVVGGGTAGYFAALALRKALPSLEVTVIESSAIPIIGVGEATTTLMPPFLHVQLGLDPVELYAEVEPTWKLGIQFDWGPDPAGFAYPFGATWPLEAMAHDGGLAQQSFTAMAMADGTSPILRAADGGVESLLPWLKFAYHLDNKRFVRYLRKCLLRAGVAHIDARIATVQTSADGERVDALLLDDGRRLAFDLYVDASGFTSLLSGQALQTPFIDYRTTLLCDTALVAEMPHGGRIRPYTQAESMDAGWCWRIPVVQEDHRGYVFSSQFLSLDAAHAEMRAKNPQMGEPWVVRFRSGRHRDFWRGNVAAVGNAYGFVEPLESTALHMVIVELAYLIGGLRAGGDLAPHRAHANEHVGGHWDYLRWFLGLHYRFNRRYDTPFWRACRHDVDISGLAEFVSDFETHGPWRHRQGLAYPHRDPAFSFEGLMILLMGQRVAAPTPQVEMPADRWRDLSTGRRALADRALPQAEALAALRAQPELLRGLLDTPGNWLTSGAELLHVRPEAGEHVRPLGNPPAPDGPYAAWLTGSRLAQRMPGAGPRP